MILTAAQVIAKIALLQQPGHLSSAGAFEEGPSKCSRENEDFILILTALAITVALAVAIAVTVLHSLWN